MIRTFARAAALSILLIAAPALGAVATIYADNAGCESSSTTLCSGTTDSASASAKGAGSTITCSATSGPAAAPGCIITGTQGAAGQIAAIPVDGSQALFVNCATNSNQKIFFINAVDDVTGAVGTTVTPTGCTAATSNWGIGGRMIWAPANVESALRGGDTVLFNNNPATRTTTFFTARNSGDNTNGMIRLVGKVGVRPLLHVTSGNVAAITLGALNSYYIENLELQTDGATSVGSAALSTTAGSGSIASNIKVSNANTAPCVSTGTGSLSVYLSELTSCADGFNGNGLVFATYIHNVTGDCVEATTANPNSSVMFSVLASCGGRGVFVSGTITGPQQFVAIINTTIYGNTLAGIEVTDADARLGIYNSIVMNTNSADIVKWTAGNAQTLSSHAYNVFFSSSTGVLNGLTANATETVADPLFTNAGAADFTLQTGSPAKASGFPGQLLGGNLGYLDRGALQRQEPTPSASGHHIICGALGRVQVANLCP